MDRLPEEHKAKWFSGSALTAAEQSMASVMSTVLSRLNTFLDSELEQVLCFDSTIDAESFAAKKSAIFSNRSMLSTSRCRLLLQYTLKRAGKKPQVSGRNNFKPGINTGPLCRVYRNLIPVSTGVLLPKFSYLLCRQLLHKFFLYFQKLLQLQQNLK